MKGLIKRIKGWLRRPSLVALMFVAFLVFAAIVGALQTDDPSSRTPPAQSGSDASYTAPECHGSSDLTDAAHAIVDSGNATMYPAAKRLYEEVIASGIPADRACAASGLAQLLEKEDAEATAAASNASWEQKLEKSWSKWTKANVDPLKQAFIAAAGILVLLLTLSRLLTGAFVRPDSMAPDVGRRRAWWLTGILLVVAASLSPVVAARTSLDDNGWWPVAAGGSTLVLVLSLLPWKDMHWDRAVIAIGCAGLVTAVLAAPPLDVNLLLLAGAWAAAVGVALVAFARGLALAIEVQVRGSSGDDNASRARMMVARLQELGSENPRDIRVIGASDVTSLPEDALTTVPTGTFATAAFNVLKLMRPAAPWRITLSQPDDATLVMEITRNRTAVPEGSMVVNVADLPKPRPAGKGEAAAKADEKQDEPKARDLDDLLTIAAAHTLLVLADVHSELKEGLCGARRWRALALHAIALRPGTSPERRSVLLHAAVDASPRFILPRMALVNEIDDGDDVGRLRYASEIDKLWREFKNKLEPGGQLNKVPAGYEAAQLRMLYNQAVAWMNVRTDWALAGQTNQAKDAWGKSAKASLALSDRIDLLIGDEQSPLKELVEESVRPAGFLLLDLCVHRPSDDVLHVAEVKKRGDELDPEGEKLTPQTRNDFYGRACYYASRAAEAEWKRALIDLQVAVSAPRFAEWAPRDPSMAVFTMSNESGKRASDSLIKEFKKLVTAPPPASYLELSMFRPHAELLRAYGMTQLADVGAVPRDMLANTAKVHPSVAQRWIEAARLDDFLRQLGEADDTTRLQLLDLLLSMDVTSRPDLVTRLSGDQESLNAFYVAMVKKALTKRIVPTWEETIKRWTGAQKPSALMVK